MSRLLRWARTQFGPRRTRREFFAGMIERSTLGLPTLLTATVVCGPRMERQSQRRVSEVMAKSISLAGDMPDWVACDDHCLQF